MVRIISSSHHIVVRIISNPHHIVVRIISYSHHIVVRIRPTFYVIHPWIELSKKSDPVFFFQGMEKLSLNVGVKSSQVHQPTCFWKSGGDPV